MSDTAPAPMDRIAAIEAITLAATQLDDVCRHQLGVPPSALTGTGPIQLGNPGAGVTIPISALVAPAGRR